MLCEVRCFSNIKLVLFHLKGLEPPSPDGLDYRHVAWDEASYNLKGNRLGKKALFSINVCDLVQGHSICSVIEINKHRLENLFTDVN